MIVSLKRPLKKSFTCAKPKMRIATTAFIWLVVASNAIPVFGADNTLIELSCGDGTETSIAEIVEWDGDRPTLLALRMANGTEFTVSPTEEDLSLGFVEEVARDENGRLHARLVVPEGSHFLRSYEFALRESPTETEVLFHPTSLPSARVHGRILHPARPIEQKWIRPVLRWLCARMQARLSSQCQASCRKTCEATGVKKCAFEGWCGLRSTCKAQCKR